MRTTLLGLVLAAATLAAPSTARSQETCPAPATARGGESRTVQPRIVVIPYTNSGEDIRTVLEADVNRRIAVTRVREGFDARRFSTVDLRGAINAVDVASGITMLSQTDLKTRIIEQSRADIYVEVEVLPESAQGELRNASVALTAYVTANGMSLANRIGHSGRFRGVEYARLVERAAGDSLDLFLDTMQEKFDEIVTDGVVASLDVSSREGARHTLASEVGPEGQRLGDLVESWLETHAWMNTYNISGSTGVRMIADEVRIPLRDPETCNNYNASRFARELATYLRGLGVSSEPTIMGTRIFLELQ